MLKKPNERPIELNGNHIKCTMNKCHEQTSALSAALTMKQMKFRHKPMQAADAYHEDAMPCRASVEGPQD
jgi:hypothetical protein